MYVGRQVSNWEGQYIGRYVSKKPQTDYLVNSPFADDKKLYRRIYNDTDYNVLQNDINKVDEWTRLWLLKLIPDKCKCMTLFINKKANNQKYFLNTPLGVNELQKSK